MDKHLMDTPFFRLGLERPYLTGNVFECFDEQVEPFAIKFELRFAFVFVHAQISSFKLPDTITPPRPPLPPPRRHRDTATRCRASGGDLSRRRAMWSMPAPRLRRADVPRQSRRH